MNVKQRIDIAVLALLIIMGIALTYIYSIVIAAMFTLSIIGAWYFATGIFAENKKYEAFIKTSTHRVIIGGFLLSIGMPLLILYLIGDTRIALIAFIAFILATILIGSYPEKK
jgi:archaellum biogenesis protein FlaJ (TadC family)